jgi:TatD DNase family protein
MIETHCHLDGVEFAEDRNQVVERARAAGVEKIFVPAIDAKSVETVLDTCRCYPDYCYPMLGLHPEEVRADWREQLSVIRAAIQPGVIAIGEVGLDYYWSREYAAEQIEAFEQQVCWSIEMRLPLMIHCRKAQNEMVALLRKYKDDLPGGVFHCFTGNALEAAELLQFDRFVLGVGGVLTFKKSHLPEVLASAVPMDRVVLETDSPYMAPVPHRGQRNEPAFVADVLQRMAESYGVSREEMERRTNENVERIFGIQ